MYQIEEIVVEKNSGLSRIQDIREEDFGGRGAVLYYVLQPFADRGATVYVPVHSEQQKLRSLYTDTGLKETFEKIKGKVLEWSANDKERQQKYQELVKQGSFEELCLLIRTLLQKRKETEENGKKFRAVDERILKEAEFRVCPEIAYVLEIEEEEVLARIME